MFYRGLDEDAQMVGMSTQDKEGGTTGYHTGLLFGNTHQDFLFCLEQGLGGQQVCVGTHIVF